MLESHQTPIDVGSMSGMHLFHAALSNCSQRVRLVLEEKQISWISHLINLGKCENLTDEFRRLNPKALVPVLVSDGEVVADSVDILKYIDAKYPEPALTPSSKIERDKLAQWLTRIDEIQSAVKVLTYEYFLKPKGMFSPEQVDFYLSHQVNSVQREFIESFSVGFSEDLLKACTDEVESICQQADGDLATSEYLVGEQLTLADLAFVVNVHRFQMLGLDAVRKPHLQCWFGALKARASFKSAVLDYVP